MEGLYKNIDKTILTSDIGSLYSVESTKRNIISFQYGLTFENKKEPIIPNPNCTDHLKARIIENAAKLADFFYTGSSNPFDMFPHKEYTLTRKEYAEFLGTNEKMIDKVLKTLVKAEMISITRKKSYKGTNLIIPNIKRMVEIKNKGYSLFLEEVNRDPRIFRKSYLYF